MTSWSSEPKQHAARTQAHVAGWPEGRRDRTCPTHIAAGNVPRDRLRGTTERPKPDFHARAASCSLPVIRLTACANTAAESA